MWVAGYGVAKHCSQFIPTIGITSRNSFRLCVRSDATRDETTCVRAKKAEALRAVAIKRSCTVIDLPTDDELDEAKHGRLPALLVVSVCVLLNRFRVAAPPLHPFSRGAKPLVTLGYFGECKAVTEGSIDGILSFRPANCHPSDKARVSE